LSVALAVWSIVPNFAVRKILVLMSEEKNVGNLKAELARLRTAEKEEINWDAVDGYSVAERSAWTKKYDSTLMDLTERRIVKGKVISVDDREVIINIGFKSEGIIPISEFRDKNAVKPGDEIEVYLETVENKSGQMIVSRRLANSMRTWERINSALDEDIIMEGIVKRRTKGGFVVDLEGIEAFLPGSQIDVKPIRDYDYYVGQRMEFKVVKINHTQNNVVISHKALIEKDLEAQKTEIINNLEKGQILEGIVKNITNFGVFIDLGGVDGLLHITDISWGRVNDPNEVLHLDQKLNVVVLDFDDEKKRISLGLKQLQPHPWENLPEEIADGKVVKGKVVTITDYGIFIEVMPGVEGLIHVSEMSWSQHLKNPQELFNVGDEVEAKIIQLQPEDRKMSLGIKQLTKDPWEDAESKYAVGSRHIGIVRNITNFGLFVELEEGIDGLIHVHDLSWSKKITHPSEFIQKDEKLEVIVLELDKEGRKLRLGHKQLTEDPWETLESVFPVDSQHAPTITKLTDAGALVELEYGIEGFIPSKMLKVQEGKPDFKEGDTVPSIVIEFNKDARRIVLSHTRTWQAGKEEEIVVYENKSSGNSLGDNADLAKLADAPQGETSSEPVLAENTEAN
jgi:small subunit ribosomal protein S1